jgi:hypothetical protein
MGLTLRLVSDSRAALTEHRADAQHFRQEQYLPHHSLILEVQNSVGTLERLR